MRSQFDVNVSAFPRQWPLMTLKSSFSICPSRSLGALQLGWSTRRSTTCCLAHKQRLARSQGASSWCSIKNASAQIVRRGGSSYRSSGSLNLPLRQFARDLGRSISDGSIHRILSDNLILENMTHQSARRDSHHQRVDGSAGRAYLWGYWCVYSGCPRTLLLPICLSVCQSEGARSSVSLQNSSFLKDLTAKSTSSHSYPQILNKDGEKWLRLIVHFRPNCERLSLRPSAAWNKSRTAPPFFTFTPARTRSKLQSTGIQ